jgi:hypothetical protein
MSKDSYRCIQKPSNGMMSKHSYRCILKRKATASTDLWCGRASNATNEEKRFSESQEKTSDTPETCLATFWREVPEKTRNKF